MNDDGMAFRMTTTANTTGIQRAEKALQANVKETENLNNTLKETISILGAVAAGVGLAKNGVESFMHAEDVFAKLDTAFASSGMLTDSCREKIVAMVGDLEKSTGISGLEWTEAITRLTQSGASESNIQASIDAVKNLAGILNGDLLTATMMVSKAMQGSFEIFAQYGLKVSETGAQTQKLNQLYQELSKRGAGRLEARMQTASTQTAPLLNGFKSVTTGVGGWIGSTGIIQTALSGLNSIVGTLSQMIGVAPDKLKSLTNAQVPAVMRCQPATIKPGSESRETDPRQAEEDHANQSNEVAEPRLHAINESLKTPDKVHELKDKTTNANRLKETPDEDLNSQLNEELSAPQSAATTQAAIQSHRAEYQRYYSSPASHSSHAGPLDLFGRTEPVSQHPEFHGRSKTIEDAAKDVKLFREQNEQSQGMILDAVRDLSASQEAAKREIQKLKSQIKTGWRDF